MNKLIRVGFITMKSPKKCNIKIKTLDDLKKKNIDKNDMSFSNNFWHQLKRFK